jgi:hypothetical protein
MAETTDEQRRVAQQIDAATQIFEKDVGTWDAAVEICPAPGAPPLRSKGTAVSRRACGGRWLITDFRNETGFEGHGVYGWDAGKGKYTGVWVDGMRTFIAVSEGSYDPETGTMTFVTEALINGNQTRWRETTETRDRQTQVYRSFMPGPDGREFEMMTVTYTRRSRH